LDKALKIIAKLTARRPAHGLARQRRLKGAA
jgi:hypothetical protein